MTFLGFGVFAACTPPREPRPEPIPPPTDTGTAHSAAPLPTADTAHTGRPTGDTGTPYVFDCSTVPLTPLSARDVPVARGSYDLRFDDQGWLYGWDRGLMKADAYGNRVEVSPPLGNIQGMDWLPDGDLVVSEIATRALLRVDVTTGSVTLISTDIDGYGVKVGPDGLIYAGTDDAPGGGKLVRVDPASGAREVLIDDPRFNVRSIDFSPDYTKLYMGTYFGDGRFWAVDLDTTYTPVGDAYVFNPDVGNGIEHDAVGVDVCGNVYVVDYGRRTLYRLAPDGRKQTYVNFPASHYGHGIAWGSGVGGWSSTAIYLPQPWYGNTVFEIEVGVPSRSWTP